MNIGKPQRGFHGPASLLVALVLGACASTQVVNNSGTLLDTVKVGSVELSENLHDCAGGCATGFKWVWTGDHTIQMRETPSGSWLDIGAVGPFESGRHYAVNVKKVAAQYCAELWRRLDTGPEFNNDTTKQLIVSHCP